MGMVLLTALGVGGATIIGAGLGYDAGDKQVVLDGQVIELFSFWLAVLYWFLAFALGILFLAVARILELLDR